MCFDEFHVSDIADAMILGRLLTSLFAAGVVFVMTSNYPPDGPVSGTASRQNFVPTIRLHARWLDVVEVDGGVDYRLRALEHAACLPGAQRDRRGRGDGGRVRSDAHGPDEPAG